MGILGIKKRPKDQYGKHLEAGVGKLDSKDLSGLSAGTVGLNDSVLGSPIPFTEALRKLPFEYCQLRDLLSTDEEETGLLGSPGESKP